MKKGKKRTILIGDNGMYEKPDAMSTAVIVGSVITICVLCILAFLCITY